MNDLSVREATEPDSRTLARRRRRRRIGIAILVLVLAIVVPPFIHVGRFQHSILRSISAGLGRPVHASSVDLVLLPRPGFVLHRFTVSEDPAFGAEPVLTADEVTATVRLSTLWHRRIEIASLRFEHPSVNLVRNAQGHWNFESLLRNSPVLQRRRTAAENGMPPSDSLAQFPYVEATGARINVKFGAVKLPFSLEGADLALWKESAREWRVRIKARPVRTDLTVANAGQIRVRVSLSSTGTFMQSPLKASVEWRHVQLGEISRLLLGNENGWRGAVDWTAQVRGTLSDAQLRSDIAIEGFRRAEFLPAEDMNLSAHCEGRVVRDDKTLDSLECEAPLDSGRLLVRGLAAVKPVRTGSGHSDNIGHSRRNDAAFHRHRSLARSLPIEITLKKVPAGFFLDLLRHVHSGVVPDARVSGEVNGTADCAWRGQDTLASCTGEFRSDEVRLHLARLRHPLVFSPLVLESAGLPIAASIRGPRPPAIHVPARRGRSAAGFFRPAAWNLLPAEVSLGGPTPVTITGAVASTGTALQFRGPADAAELARLAQALRIPAMSGAIQSIRGDADLSLVLRSRWLPTEDLGQEAGSDVGSEIGSIPEADSGSATKQTGSSEVDADAPIAMPGGPAPSRWTGSLKLHNVTLKLAVLPLPVHLTSAQVDLSTTTVEWSGAKGTFANVPFEASLRWRVPCPSLASDCARSFVLQTPDLNIGHLQAALRRYGDQSSLLSRFNPWASGPSQLPEISGTVHADVLSVGLLSLDKAMLKFRIEGQRANLMAISGQIFGGTLSGGPVTSLAVPGSSKLRGAGSVEWGSGAPVYILRATLDRIRPTRVAAIWHEHWGSGTANVGLDLQTHGWSADELSRNAHGTFAFAWMHGSFLPTSASTPKADAGIDKFYRWMARGTLRDRTLRLESSQLMPEQAHRRRHSRLTMSQSVSGTITSFKTLHLLLRPSGIRISGPLDAPVIARVQSSQVENAHGGLRTSSTRQ